MYLTRIYVNFLNILFHTQKAVSVTVVLYAFLWSFFLPVEVLGQSTFTPFSSSVIVNGATFQKDFPNRFPVAAQIPARYSTYVTATAYNSEVGQTDDTPCHTANGFNVCEHGYENIVATNNLPLGTRVRFPDLHGDRIFYVMDRMNPRYTSRVDFWMKEKKDAKSFGKRSVRMEVL